MRARAGRHPERQQRQQRQQRSWWSRLGLHVIHGGRGWETTSTRELKVRTLGPSTRPLTGVCKCGMAFFAYWSHRQTIQHQLWVRLRKREQREQREQQAAQGTR
jgi:hypothetical protein